MVSCRLMRAQDLPDVAEICHRVYLESSYSKLPFDWKHLGLFLINVLSTPETQVAFVVEKNGKVIGVLGAYLVPYMFSPALLCQDFGIMVDKDYRGSSAGRRLVEAMEQWAKSKGAVEILPGISSGIQTDRTVKFFEKMGYKKAGTILKKVL